MLSLVLALGFAIASPQIILAVLYYHKSVRSHIGYQEKVAIGNGHLFRLLKGLVTTRDTTMVNGVFYPEGVVYIGLIPLIFVMYSRNPFWWSVALVSAFLAMGKYTPLFRWTHWCHLRIPVRYSYFFSLALVFLVMDSLRYFYFTQQQVWIICVLQMWDFAMNTSRLIPMQPYTQRWEKPSRAFGTALVMFLSGCQGRISGLPYPLRCGHIPRFRTLGDNGGGQLQAMATFRGETNPNGSGAHDWFALNEDDHCMNWYGVQYAYTYRSLTTPKWLSTDIQHLYCNTQVHPHLPSWEELEKRYGISG